MTIFPGVDPSGARMDPLSENFGYCRMSLHGCGNRDILDIQTHAEGMCGEHPVVRCIETALGRGSRSPESRSSSAAWPWSITGCAHPGPISTSWSPMTNIRPWLAFTLVRARTSMGIWALCWACSRFGGASPCWTTRFWGRAPWTRGAPDRVPGSAAAHAGMRDGGP